MIVTFDTEFLDDGRVIELISLGMVAEDGRTLYAVNGDADWQTISFTSPWVVENVIKRHIPHYETKGIYYANWSYFEVTHRGEIANGVEDFLASTPDPQLWAYYSATDHVALYQLFGSLIVANCDHGIPLRTSCLKQEEESIQRRIRRNRRDSVPEDTTLDELVNKIFQANYGDRPVQDPETEHHALWDAEHDMELARWLGLTS